MIHEDHILIYSGGEDHSNGIGILMKKSVNASLMGFWPISDRVMMAKIKGQPFDINIIQAYAPTSDNSDDETQVFYEEMKQAMSYKKCGEVVIAMGDLMIANTYFQHPKRRLYTRRSPGDIYRNQIDFILINKRFRNGVKQACTYLGANVGSDHNPELPTLASKKEEHCRAQRTAKFRAQ